MKDYLIRKRLKELLGTKQSFDNSTNNLLFDEYMADRAKSIPLEEIEARTLLILGNEHIIYFVLKKQFGICGNYDNFDEFAEGKIGLVQAVDEYNNERGTQFVTFAYQVITHRIYKYYNRLNNLSNIVDKQKISLNEYISNEYNDKKEKCLEDILMVEDNFIEQFVENDLLVYIKKSIEYLTENEAFCIINSFGLFGRPCIFQEDIAKKLGISQSNVSRNIKSATNKLRILSMDDSSLSKQDLKLKHALLKQGPQNNLIIQGNCLSCKDAQLDL